ncbi:hypothetical protein [Psychromicrobium xiongbiense]|uniref:hypothetical protein n=1 Tax=Psychromicrobium xiongbiense TaxID=3051184 RepID=UPI00255549A8|nr:hypothetical protein [Psychromicrobium sp. YIM S02556]
MAITRVTAIVTLLVLTASTRALVSCSPHQRPSTSTPSSSAQPSTPNSSLPQFSAPETGATPAPPQSGTDRSEITVRIHASATGPVVTALLSCQGSSAASAVNIADPAGACLALVQHGAAAFAPPATICTQQSGGPQTAEVTGIVNGRQVDKTFDQHNGCTIEQWNLLKPLFGSAAGGGN